MSRTTLTVKIEEKEKKKDNFDPTKSIFSKSFLQ